jgi:hypothetical protein
MRVSLHILSVTVVTAAEWKAIDIGPCFLLQGQMLSIGELKMG